MVDGALKVKVIESKGVKNTEWKKGELFLSDVKSGAYIIVRVSKDKQPLKESSVLAHLKAERKKETRQRETKAETRICSPVESTTTTATTER